MHKPLPAAVWTCPHCGQVKRSEALIAKLGMIGDQLDKPLQISSGYRCERYNASLPNAGSNSAHLRGLAVDIACEDSFERYQLVWLCYWQGFIRIILYERHIHVDIDDTLPNPILTFGSY